MILSPSEVWFHLLPLGMWQPQFLVAVHPIQAAPSHPQRVPQSWGPTSRPPFLSCSLSGPLGSLAGLVTASCRLSHPSFGGKIDFITFIVLLLTLGPSLQKNFLKFRSGWSTLVWLAVVPLCPRQRDGGLGVLPEHGNRAFSCQNLRQGLVAWRALSGLRNSAMHTWHPCRSRK